MLRLLPLLIVALVWCSPAAAAELRGQAGGVTAVLTFTPAEEDTQWRDLRLTVVRNGVPGWGEPLAVRGCEVPYCRPVDVGVRDLDADGEPEVMVDVYTGGAHCCTSSLLLTWTPTGYRTSGHDWSHAGYERVDLDGDGRPELRSADARFAYEFASYARSAFPVEVWQVDGGRFENVTAGFPALVERDARRWWRAWQRSRGDTDEEPLGALSAWAADQERLGRHATVVRELRRAQRRGWLRADAPWPSGRRYLRALDRFLRSTGYRR